MVDLKALIASIERIAWKAGTHEKVTHAVEADGSHTITVRVPKVLAQWNPPTQATPTTFREHPDMTWDQITPPPRTGKKKA